MKRAATMLAVLALIVAACGDGAAETTTGGPTATTTSVPPATTAQPTTSATTVPPTTAPVTTSPPSASTDYVSVYFSVDGYIAPVARPLETGDNPALVVMQDLLRGPTPDEMAGTPAMSGVADGARLNDIQISNGIAVVDISGEFNAPTGTSGEIMRLSSLTFTLTSLPNVEKVVLFIDGGQVAYFGGHGWDISSGLTRTTFMENQGAFGSIAILDPAWWIPVTSPVTVHGYAEGFAGTVMYGLFDGDGLELAVGEADVVPTEWDHGLYEISILFEVDSAQLGSVMVWDGSQGPGAQANLVEHAVWLTPDS